MFTPVDSFDFTFMGRFLRQITLNISKSIYVDSLSSWFDTSGNQTFGLRHVHFVQNYLDTTFLRGLDKLITYSIVSELRKFCRDYGLQIGGGGISDERKKKA